MHSLIGYSEQPTAMQFITYCGVIVAMWVLMRLLAPSQPVAVRSAA